jgi:hypothetical protein
MFSRGPYLALAVLVLRPRTFTPVSCGSGIGIGVNSVGRLEGKPGTAGSCKLGNSKPGMFGSWTWAKALLLNGLEHSTITNRTIKNRTIEQRAIERTANKTG